MMSPVGALLMLDLESLEGILRLAVRVEIATKSSVKTPIGSAGRNPKQASGCNFNVSQEFSALSGTQKMPGVSLC